MTSLPTPQAPQLRLGAADAVSIDGIAYRVVCDSANGYVLQNQMTGLSEGFDHQRLASLNLAGRLEFSSDHHVPQSVRTRLASGASSLATLPHHEQREIARRLEWITRFLKREADQILADAEKPRRLRGNPSIRSKAGMIAALDLIGREIEALDELRARPPSDDGTPRKARKPRSGSQRRSSAFNAPGLRTFQTWLSDYERAGRNPLALRSKTARCGNRMSRYEPEVERLLHEHAATFASEKKPSREACHRNMRKALAELNAQREVDGLRPYNVPSNRTLARRIAALDQFLIMARREGVDAATRKHQFIIGQAEALRPGQRVEMDEWKIDLFVQLSNTDLLKDLSDEELAELRKCRWMLCVAIDVATRCILGLRVDKTSTVQNAMATLEMVVSTKEYLSAAVGAKSPWGSMALRPESIVTDSGSSFISEAFHLAVIGLGSAHDVPPAGMPHLRGTIERLFRTLSLQLVREFTGQTFENSVALGEYPALKRVSVTVEDFVLAAVRYAVDVYHNLPHEGLGGETPGNAWKRLTSIYGVIPVPGRNERRAIFGLRLERTLGRHGLRFMGLSYQAGPLREHYLKRGGVSLAIRVDPQDIGSISVDVDGTWHEARATTAGFDGVRLADHQALCEQLAKRYVDQARVSESVVFEALNAIQGRAAAAERAATFLTKFAEPEDIDRAERNLKTFAFPEKMDSPGYLAADPLADILPTGVSAGVPRTQSAEATGGKPPARSEPRRSHLRVEQDAPEQPVPRKRPRISIDD